MGELADRGPETTILGRCPSCDVAIPTDGPSIEYETDSGWPLTFAECPSCSDVVHPR